jgi:hypothetical protein
MLTVCQIFKKNPIINTCRAYITKSEDFDEVMLVVQVCVGKGEFQDVLLDGESSMNIILDVMRMKLGLRKPKSTPL